MSERRQQRRVVLAIILAGYLLVLIDVSILMAALPSIRADLGFCDTSLSWAQNAYTLTFGGLLLLGARAGDLLGRRRTFVLGIGAVHRRLAGRRPGAVAGLDDRRPRRAGHRRRARWRRRRWRCCRRASPRASSARARWPPTARWPASAPRAGLIIGGALTRRCRGATASCSTCPIGLAAILAAPRCLAETVRHAGRLDVAGALCSTFGAAALVFGIVHSADAGWSAG